MTRYFRIGIGDLLEHPLGNDIGRRGLPVIGVDVQPHRDIAHGLSDLYRYDLVARRRVRIAKERGAEQPHRPPGEGLEEALRRIDLERDERVRQLREVRMGKSVISDVIPLSQGALHEVRIGFSILANDEEGPVDALLFQDIENSSMSTPGRDRRRKSAQAPRLCRRSAQ